MRLPSPKLTKYITHRPTPKQRLFLLLHNYREAFYGGAAGGGKSDSLLMAALQYVDVPGYAALLLRRTYADLSLPGALMDRADQWLQGTDAHWNGQEKTWTFPSGATVTFGYLENEKDKYRYQGSELQFVGFDELTQFSESQYRYLFSRLRRLKNSEVPIRMRAASNPGGLGHEWVKQRFIVEGKKNGRVFVPARLVDNPHLDQVEYRQSLEALDAVTRAQLLAGDWDAKTGGLMFKREWFEIVETSPERARRVRYWDLASTEAKAGKDPDFTSGCRLAEADGIFYIEDMQHFRGSPGTVEKRVRQTAELDGKAVPIQMEQEGGASGVNTIDHYARRVLTGFAFYGDKKTGSKIEMARPVSAAAEKGNIKLVRGNWIGPFLDELEAFPLGAHDDQVDALSGSFNKLAGAKTFSVGFF